MRQSLVIVLAVCALATAGLAARNQPAQAPRVDAAPKPNEIVTVTGCVAAGANHTFTLTAPAREGRNNGEPVTGTTMTTPAGSKIAKTIEYTLVPASSDVDLKSEVGHTVQVTGREAPPQVSTSASSSASGTAQGATGTSGSSSGANPKVKTTTQTQIVVRQLTVSAVKKVAGKCDLVK